MILVSHDLRKPERPEFFVWIRPPHRSIGLGSRVVPARLEEVVQRLSGRELIVRYPRSKGNLQVNLEHAAWRRFFVTCGFSRPVEEMSEATVLQYSRVGDH